MKSIYELRQFIQKYGTFIYTGDRIGDLELLETELRQLYEWQMIDSQQFQQGIILIKKELSDLRNSKKD